MSSPPAPRPRWVRWLSVLGPLALMAFPWCSAAVPDEAINRYMLWWFAMTITKVAGLAYTALFVTIFVHECGHWFFGWLMGIRIREFVVGTGSSPLRFKWLGIHFSFGPWLRWGFVREVPSRAN